MILLSVETATLKGSVALGRRDSSGVSILYSRSWSRERSHGELLTPMIEEALSATKTEAGQIAALAVDVGPGSFTGIRVGLSAVRTLAYVHNLPIYTFNSLEVLAFQAGETKLPVVSLINAHKNQCYVGTFERNTNGHPRPLLAPCALSPEELEQTLTGSYRCVGEGYLAFEHLFSGSLKARLQRSMTSEDFPLAQTLVQMALSGEFRTQTLDWKALEPLYIRSSEAEEKLRSGKLKPLPEF